MLDPASEDLKALAQLAHTRLTTDERAQEVFARLRKRGVSDRDIEWLGTHLPTILPDFEASKRETVAERDARLAKLVQRLRAFADELDAHEETRNITIHDATVIEHVFNEIADRNPGRVDRRRLTFRALYERQHLIPDPRLVTFLRGSARFLERDHWLLDWMREPRETLPRKRQIATFAILRVYGFLDDAIARCVEGRWRAPNVETATLVNVLLGLNGKGAITANDVTQARRKERARHVVESPNIRVTRRPSTEWTPRPFDP